MTQEGKAGPNVHLTDLIDCPKCGHSNAIGTRYCDGCGASLAGVESRQAKQAMTSAKDGWAVCWGANVTRPRAERS